MSTVQSFFPILDPAPSSKPGRKDGSAMFSLGSLIERQASPAPPPAPPAAPAPRSLRSGLIDLSALRDNPEVVADHLAVFPLGAPESKRPAAVSQSIAAAPARARRPIGALVAAVAIAAAGIGIAAGILRNAEARGPAAVTGVAGVARALPARLPAERRVEPTPAPVDPGVTPPAPAPPAPSVIAVTPRPTVTARPPAPPKPPTPPIRPSDPCRGDLMCAMQQAVNKKK